MVKVVFELTEDDLRSILAEHFRAIHRLNLEPKEIQIQVKSKQNYKSEWESASFRANFEITR